MNNGLKLFCCWLALMVLVTNCKAQSDVNESVINQSILLTNSERKIISALDSVVDRSFFTTKQTVVQCVNGFPDDVYIELVLWRADSLLTPYFYMKEQGVKLSEYAIKQILQAPINAQVMIGAKGNVVDGVHHFYGSLVLRLGGPPAGANHYESEAAQAQEVWLENSKGDKLTENDTTVSRAFFEQRKVRFVTNRKNSETPELTILKQKPDGEWETYKWLGTEFTKEAKDEILEAIPGFKVMILCEYKKPLPGFRLRSFFSLTVR